ncbi:hypothetical protein [Maricaulis sp.]|uniref:hypothetical protein n=1 Tax=Maricaulis sp. TaxID=1486257 RepID=UPI003A954025
MARIDMNNQRANDIERFYSLMGDLAQRTGGAARLGALNRSTPLPDRGVYFFFEPGEDRARLPGQGRVVRIGTHALKSGGKTTLRNRLSNHRGSLTGSGNHRGSIFRLLIGQALVARGDLDACPSWGCKGEAKFAAMELGLPRERLKALEMPVEAAVSTYLGNMSYLVVDIPDEPGPTSARGLIERNSIALLTHWQRDAISPPSASWLGLHSNRSKVSRSGLWNQNHVEEDYNPHFLDVLEQLAGRMKRDND